jgi:predicted metalloprotease with PDZ domain
MKPPALIEHRVEIDDLAAHRFRVTLTVPQPAALQTLSLPVWIPGSYMVRDFSRHVLSVQARQGRRVCAMHATAKAQWDVVCEGRAALTVQLVVYAFDTSVRAAYLDAQRGFFNGTSVCLQVHGRTQEPQALVVGRLPAGWRIATAMRPDAVDARGIGRYLADDYDELVDHPFELGHFWSGRFKAGGVAHELVVSGAWPDADLARLLRDTQRICASQIAFWHADSSHAAAPAGVPRSTKPPFQRYVFLLNTTDDGYGGLEHRASTALQASRRDLPALDAQASSSTATRAKAAASERPDAVVTLLGLISHEYFHTWNVKRLKPRELSALDYSRENHTELLWFFEGFTSYYDDLMLLRAGLIDAARYLKLLGKTISGVLSTPGRHVQSVAEASHDAWIKYYRSDENTPNTTVSYYAKGALVALLADLRLRDCGGSLDGAMRRLWAASGASRGAARGPAGGIDEAMIAEAMTAEAGMPMGDELATWVHGRDDLPLQDALARHAVGWVASPPSVAQRMGWRVQEVANGLRIAHVLHGGLAHAAGLAAGDELWAVDDWRIRRADEVPRLLPASGRAQLLVARDQRVLRCRLPVEAWRGCTQDAQGAEGTQRAHTPAQASGVTVNLALLTEGQAPDDARARRDAWLAAMALQ